ncbi:MAG TPA: alpha/beta fold hydrolase [Phototrophicaceae bacterium]|nr:alpha/beta fold hydrolase [Phototrophicaceae bacterium]
MFATIMFAVIGLSTAQDTPIPATLVAIEPLRVEVPASDGLTLVGDLYSQPDAPEDGAPSVMLMHMYNSNRAAWEPIIQPLLDAGYNILNVDLRGFGETGGDRNWTAATGDVQTWLDWLRTQPGVNPEQIATMGGSIGSNLAIIGCANDEKCVTAIALSPGADYFGLQPESYINEGLRRRSVLILASHSDRQSSVGVKQMVADSSSLVEVGARLYTGSTHGTSLLLTHEEAVRSMILDWLAEHMG